MRLSASTTIYALLAALGAALPWYFNLQFLAAAGNLTDFLRAGFANPAVAGHIGFPTKHPFAIPVHLVHIIDDQPARAGVLAQFHGAERVPDPGSLGGGL